MKNLNKIFFIPVYLTDLQYREFCRLSRFAGGSHHLFTHLLLTGAIHSNFIKSLSNKIDKVR